jgi:signal peptidase II
MPVTTGRRLRRMGIVAAIGAAVIAVDQLTKTWAEHRLATRSIHIAWTLRLKLAFNPGVAFSLGQGSTPLVTVVALVLVAVLVAVAWRSSGRALAVALALIVGGATSNLADRLVRHNGGQVIDFIDLRWWPVFNVADACITCGVILALAVSALRRNTP